MLTSKQCFIFLGILSLNTPLLAQIITDGTLGIETSLTGPNIEIPADLGQQHSSNLFHSFKEFNINTGQTATFTGPDTVQNILTRVTGDQRSFLDGTLRSEIPNANLYLLNPNGIVFGENAKLEVSGAFYASTADGVDLGEDGKFLARSPNDSVLTTAQPSDFGFLDSQPASIEIQGSTLAIKNHTYYAPNGQINVTADSNIYLEDSTLYAPNGQISITSPSELRIVQTPQKLFKQFDINEDGESEMIANLDVSGLNGGGNITIRANSFVSDKGWIFADIWGNQYESNENGGEITFQVRDFEITDSEISVAGGHLTIEGNPDRLAKKIRMVNSKLTAKYITIWTDDLLFLKKVIRINIIVADQYHRRETLTLLTLRRCTSFSKDHLSRFLITARDILPRSPEDLKTHTIRLQ